MPGTEKRGHVLSFLQPSSLILRPFVVTDPNFPRRSGMVMLAIAWVLIIGGVYWFFSGWDARQANPNPQAALDQQQGELTLLRNRDGHYVADGEINGRRVTVLVDTGATWVALSQELARKLRLQPGAAVPLQTANGSAIGYQVRLDSIRVGPIEMHDIAALVTAGLAADTVLLGMNFLKRLEMTQRGDQLILKVVSAKR